MKKKIAVSLIILAIVAILVFPYAKNLAIDYLLAPRQPINTPNTTKTPTQDIEIIAKNLDIPWEIAFLPNKDMLVTERSGKLLKIGAETKTIQTIEGIRHKGEGGLSGLAIHPKFNEKPYIYVYLTTQDAADVNNRVEQYTLTNDTLTDRKVILEGIKGANNHDGGRIAFGPDGYLYITTGDAENSALAQDKNSLNGKILRIKDDGSIPEDNPFGNAVYSMGHRNPQGLAWDSNGKLWQNEHGPSGLQTGYDEVNLIIKGENYGWPTIKGDQTQNGLVAPFLQSGSEDTWAPAGMAYLDGSLFFTGLRGQTLYEIKTNQAKPTLIEHLKQKYGRLRAITGGPDGFLYVGTSNRDGRGTPNPNDDLILKINVKNL